MLETSEPGSRGAFGTILAAWATAGSLDIGGALVYYPLTAPITPVRLLQGIASGVFGPRAYAGGLPMAAWGLVFHYLIALAWTVVFYAACSAVRSLARRPFPVGMAYGVVVWAAMNLVVLPLSHYHRPTPTAGQAIVAALFLMFCIGLPNAIIIGRYVSRNALAPPSATE